jgi:hypothetical protein
MPGNRKDPPPSKTSHLFGSRKADQRAPFTHERVAADIEAFRKAGGKIEVLGVTRSLLRVGVEATEQPSPPAKAAPSPTRRR